MLTSMAHLPITGNPLETREDIQHAVRQLCEPLTGYYSEGKARLHLGVTGTSYSGATAGMEGFSRVLWGLVPLAAGGGDSPLWETCLEGIRNGTDPGHAEYWGEVNDYDQLLVEMAALGFALALAPERIWEPLNEKEKTNFYAWLSQINDRELYDCNWLFFQVLVSLGFRRIGMPYDKRRMEAKLERIEAFYLDNGWYADGIQAHCDYYGPFAIHYYSLLYAKLMEREDPRRAALYKERSALFAKEFIYWFAEEGDALPYGRSLAYRFSQAAFWGALEYADASPFAPGVVKGIVLRHLRWWFRQPIFQTDGTLTIGYSYPNLIMSENYNSPGSPYWAFKVFLPLALAKEHPFWSSEELPLPELEASRIQAEPRMIICRQRASSHILAFNAGCTTTNQHTHTSAKYEKFVYSNKFGFSVPRAEWGLSQSACDSMLALSEGDQLYRVKRQIESYAIDGNKMMMRWRPWHDVVVQTWLITGAPWHIRIHRINSARPLDAADGGFALGLADGPRREERTEGGTAAISAYGASGAVALHGWGKADLLYVQTNTNVLHPRTVIPTLTVSLPAGTSLLASAFYGQPETAATDSLSAWSEQPVLTIEGDTLVIRTGSEAGSELYRIHVAEQPCPEE